MLGWTLAFYIISSIVAALGFLGIAIVSTEIARNILVIFLVMFVASLMMYLTGKMFSLLTWMLTFLIVSIAAGLLGFAGIAIVSAEIVRIIFLISLALFVVSFYAFD